MGCGFSKKDESGHAVLLCSERKKLMKMAVKNRQAFADAHCKYIHSLYAISAAIKLFVARYSSPPSPFLITLPSPTTNPSLSDSENTRAGTTIGSPDPGSDSLNSDARNHHGAKPDQLEEDGDSGVCEYFYGDTATHDENRRDNNNNNNKPPPPMPSPKRESGWDFFNLFDDGGFRVLDEREIDRGCAVADEGGERSTGTAAAVRNAQVGKVKPGDIGIHGGKKEDNGGVKVVDNDSHHHGRELLEALKDVEDHFIRCYESGLDISRMLEVNYKVKLQSGLEEIKENSGEIIQPITWQRTDSSRSSSCKSLLSSSTKCSSTWTEPRSEVFDGCGGMTSGSHSFTVGRLYAWEKKLYREVKAGEQTRRSYRQKCSQLRKKDGWNDLSTSKKGAEVEALYNRILIGIKTTESISGQIEKLRDEELQPQLVELLQGLMDSWKIMMECHEIQKKTILEVKSFLCPASGKFCNDSHRLATLQLEAELQNWQTSFLDYVTTQKAYVKSLHGWLSKFIDAEARCNSSQNRSSLVPPVQFNRPALLVTCQNWLASLERLPETAVKCSLKSLATDLRALWIRQGEEQQLKRKVDGVAKEIDRRALALQKEESKIHNTKMIEQVSLMNVKNQVESINERKNQLEVLKKQLDAEKMKHQFSMQETQGSTLSVLQIGFSSVFESLTEFARGSVKLYADLVMYCENATGDQSEER